jgi:hypothetical protein
MLKQCMNYAKTLREPGVAQAEIPQEAFEDDPQEAAPVVPRYLQLARAIHARFTADEEREIAVYRAAEALVASKNAVIMRAVQEVLDFCEILRNVPELNAALDKKTEDITQRLFSNRCTYTVENEPIAVQYEAPVYRVDMHMPDHISLSSVNNAYLHVSFNPVKFMVVNKEEEGEATITKHLLMKQYRLATDGTFLHFQSNEGAAADPISDIITELRAKLGHEFFEKHLMPYFEAQVQAPVPD